MLLFSPALTAYLLFLAALLGLVFGSFCNAWAWRLAHRESIAKGRSHCALCGHPLSPRDLVPLVSYALLRGRCRYCGGPISRRYPAVEAVSAAFFVSVVLRYDVSLSALRLLGLGCALLALSLVDWDTREIPDRLLALGAAFALLRLPAEGPAGLKSALAGALAVAVPLLIFVLLCDKVTGRETMGGGDIKLVAVLGLHFGPALTLLLLILACLAGLLLALPLRRRTADGAADPSAIPFGPALSLAAWAVLLFGGPLLEWYLSLFL